MKKYVDDYDTIITTDETGREKEETVYRGAYFAFTSDRLGIVQFKRVSLLLMAGFVIFQVASGFVNGRGMFQLYIALPYAFAFFPLIYLTEAVLRLPNKKRLYRRDEIERSFDRMKIASYVLMAVLGLGLLGEIAFLLFGLRKGEFTLDLYYLALQLLAALSVFFLIRIQIQPCEGESTSPDGSAEVQPRKIL